MNIEVLSFWGKMMGVCFSQSDLEHISEHFGRTEALYNVYKQAENFIFCIEFHGFLRGFLRDCVSAAWWAFDLFVSSF